MSRRAGKWTYRAGKSSAFTSWRRSSSALTPHFALSVKRGYFAHVTPENRSPFDRIREADVRFLAAGENLALAPSVQLAHNGLLKSPEHRANILRSSFGRVGHWHHGR